MIQTLAGKLLQFAAYESRSGPLIYDFSGENLTACPFSYGKNGELELTITAELSYEAAQIYLQPRPMLIYRVNDGMRVLWEGRGQIPKWRDGQLQINALGLWLSLDDIGGYTAFWSETTYEQIQPVTTLQIANRNKDLYEMDNQNRVFIGLTEGAIYATGADVGGQYYEVPSRSRTAMQTVSFDFNALLPSGFIAAVNYYPTSPFGGGVQAWVKTSTGVALTFTNELVNIPAGATVEFYILNNSGAPITNTQQNSARYAQWSNKRIKATTATTVTTQAIATHLLQVARSYNPGMLDGRTDKIGGTATYDHKQVVFEDARPTEVLIDLCTKSATGTPLTPLSVGVWGGVLTIENKGASSRTWYHDLLDIQAERDADTIANTTYATYQDAIGRTLRTAEASDQRAIDRLGVIKIDYVQADTTDATQATNQRDMLLSDRKHGTIPFTIPATTVVYDANGAPVPITEIRPGDKLVPQQFRVYDATDPLYLITIGTVTIDPIAGTVQMEAEEPIPTLETALAQQAD